MKVIIVMIYVIVDLVNKAKQKLSQIKGLDVLNNI